MLRVDIEDFIIYLAAERGLSDNYQLSTRISLEGFASWLERRKLVAKLRAEAATAGAEPRRGSGETGAEQRHGFAGGGARGRRNQARRFLQLPRLSQTR